MIIAVGCDHVGYELKHAVVTHLKSLGHVVRDFGCDSAESCDYPTYGEIVGRAVAAGECELGVLICGTGVGISLAANRVRGIRAAVCSESYTAALTRRHNDANVIAFGARVIGQGVAIEIVDAFLNASFEGDRHVRRVSMIESIDRS